MSEKKKIVQTQTIYGLICDGGDGSAHMRWYRNKQKMYDQLDRDECYQNEGSPAETLTFPLALDLEAAGFSFSDEDEIEE
jgi:hypothetical protein